MRTQRSFKFVVKHFDIANFEQVGGNDFHSVQSGICGAITRFDLYLQQTVMKVSDVCAGAQSAVRIGKTHQLAETVKYLVNDPTLLCHVIHFPTSFKRIKTISHQLTMATSGIIFMPMYTQCSR